MIDEEEDIISLDETSKLENIFLTMKIIEISNIFNILYELVFKLFSNDFKLF